jgi:hypothetical protein
MTADTDMTRHPPRPVATLATAKTDVQKAAEYKEQLSEVFPRICEIMTAAKREGITITWSIQVDAMGKAFVSALSASRDLDH